MIKDTIARIEDAVDTVRHNTDRAEVASIDVYEGHGRRGEVLLRGRVLSDFPVESAPEQGVLRNARDMLARYETDEVPEARVRVHRSDAESVDVTANDEGYYFARVDWTPPEDHDGGRWHHLHVELIEPDPREGDGTRYVSPFQYPVPQTRLCVVCDIDDTIIRTGADHFLDHVATVMTNNPYTRESFPGMPFELCKDSAHMARHARDMGLIDADALARIEQAMA